ncbi:ankyrin repeat-containing domain protein [Mycena floridula]|nr:ankyrin repeat-containing domain protein [Mycena floridula]
MIKATGDKIQWDSSTTVHTMGNAISWLHSLRSNTSIVNITTQSLYGIVQALKACQYEPYHYIHNKLAIPISSMIDVALDRLFDHSDLQPPTLTDHPKKNEVYLELVDGFLRSHPNVPKMPQSQRLTAHMTRAASDGNLALLKQFVDWGADLNARDLMDRTTLNSAAEAGHLETVKFLLEQGVDVNVKGGIMKSALAAAAYRGKIEVVEYLFNKGANPNAQDNILFWATFGGLEAVELLIDKGANLQVQGQSALAAASGSGNLDIAKLLIGKGVSPRNVIEPCSQGDLEMVKLLVRNGADVNALDITYGSALLAAIQGRQSEVVEFLIESGADVNAWPNRVCTALQLAIHVGHKGIEEILRRHGAMEKAPWCPDPYAREVVITI